MKKRVKEPNPFPVKPHKKIKTTSWLQRREDFLTPGMKSGFSGPLWPQTAGDQVRKAMAGFLFGVFFILRNLDEGQHFVL